MQTIIITCGRCEKTFDFQHPSVNKASDIMGVTLDCPHCGVVLKAPLNKLHMEPMEEYLTAIYEAAGVAHPDDQSKRGVISSVPPQ